MLSKNNYEEKLRKIEPRNDHFSIRKLTIGTVSVLLGWTLVSYGNTTAKAATIDDKIDKNPSVARQAAVQDTATISKSQNESLKVKNSQSESQLNHPADSATVSTQANTEKEKILKTTSPITKDTNLTQNSVNQNIEQNKAKNDQSQLSNIELKTQTPKLQAKSLVQEAKAAGAINFDDIKPNYNITSEAAKYDLGVTVGQGQVIYSQIYIQTLNQYVTFTTDAADPGKTLYYYTTTGMTTNGQTRPNNATTTLAATLNNPGNTMKGLMNTAAAGTMPNSLYKGGQYNVSLSMTAKGSNYYQTVISAANSTSHLNGGNSASVFWGPNSKVDWKFSAGFGSVPNYGGGASTWQSIASFVPNNVRAKIYYVNADTGELLGEKESDPTLAGNYYDIQNADPEKISVSGKNYQLVDASSVSSDVMKKEIATVNGTPILISDLKDGQKDHQGQVFMYNKGDVFITVLAAGPTYKAFVRKMLDNSGTAEYNTYTISPNEVTAGGPLQTTLDLALCRPAVKKGESFTGPSIMETNITTDGNSGIVYFYKPEQAPTPETGSITVTYHDDTDNTTIPGVGFDSGEKDVGTPVNYNPDPTIKDLENKGYKLVPGQDINIPKEIEKGAKNIVIHFVHGTTTVTPDKPGNPGQPINPNDPNGPKWPDNTGKDALEMTGSQTIHYEGAGPQTPKDNEQSTTFTKSITVDNVTGKEISSTDWAPSEHTFGIVKTPVVEGYHANVGQAGGFKSTPQDPNKTIVVTYSSNGKIISVTPDGTPIPDAPNPHFPTNPDNPTTTTDGEVPSVPGYSPETGKVGDPVKPGENPGDNVKVPYVKNPNVVATTGKVTYYDETDQKVLSIENLEGNVGESITYTTTETIAKYESEGYKFVNSDFKNGDETFKKDPSSNDFRVNFVHATITVTPDKPGEPGQPINPNDPNGPKWPDNTGKNDLEMTGSQTIKYEGAGDKTPKDNVQTTTFTRTTTVDKVTGKVISSTDWTPSEHTFGTVKTPLVEGYHASVSEAGGVKVTPQDPNKIVVVTYSPNGKIIPITPDGKPIPNAPQPPYTTNPNNPTGVTPDEKVPDIPGYTPEKSTITPDNPGKDTPVIYHKDNEPTPETGSVTVTFHDDTTNTNIPNVGYSSGEKDVGTPINYNPDPTIKDLENKGYKLVPNQDINVPKEIEKGAKNIIIRLVHGTTTVTPDKPGKPGQPINPNDPNGPKWPDNTGKDALEMTGSQTIHYEGAGSDTPKDDVQTTTFTRSVTVDDVTGKIISTSKWSPGEHTFGKVKTPQIGGYTPSANEAGGFKATPSDPKNTIVVTYSPYSPVIPDVPSNPNQPSTPTPTPDNPTPSTPNEPDDQQPDENESDSNEPTNNEPDEPENVPQPSQPNQQPVANIPTYDHNVGPHGQNPWEDTIAPHAGTVNGWINNIGPHGETVDSNGNIIAPNGEIIGYVDEYGNPHYFNQDKQELPQTGQKENDLAQAILGGVAVSLGLVGLAGVKKRKNI